MEFPFAQTCNNHNALHHIGPTSTPAVILHLLSRVDAAERCHLTVLVFAEHFAHGAGRRLTGQAVDVDLLLIVVLAHQLPLLLRLHVHQPGTQHKCRMCNLNRTTRYTLFYSTAGS